MTVRHRDSTGPIGCGKSTVAGWLGELPASSSSTPTRSPAQVVEPGEPALEEVVERFGEALRRPTGRSTGRRSAGSCSPIPLRCATSRR